MGGGYFRPAPRRRYWRVDRVAPGDARSLSIPRPRVVIVGAGFGGLAAAKALARTPAEVVVVDRRNYHLFQPLLYQVATAALSPADIAWPIRAILGRQANAAVQMGRVVGIDAAAPRGRARRSADRLRLPGARHRRPPFLLRPGTSGRTRHRA